MIKYYNGFCTKKAIPKIKEIAKKERMQIDRTAKLGRIFPGKNGTFNGKF